MRYAIVIEEAEGNYSAYVPDLPGCVATGPTVAAVETGGAERSGHGRRVRRGGPFLCPPGARRVGSSDQGTEPFL